MKERWRWVRGYKGFYRVSNLGRVKSVERVVTRTFEKSGKTVNQLIPERILSPGLTAGYLVVGLYRIGSGVFVCSGNKYHKKNFYIHELVCRAFNGPKPTPLHEVNHKGRDGNKLNNRAGNLEWVTHAQNMRHRNKYLMDRQ